jgi:hypothetical protein
MQLQPLTFFAQDGQRGGVETGDLLRANARATMPRKRVTLWSIGTIDIAKPQSVAI